MTRLRSLMEEAAVAVAGSVIVTLFCVLYWACRLVGVRLEDDF